MHILHAALEPAAHDARPLAGRSGLALELAALEADYLYGPYHD